MRFRRPVVMCDAEDSECGAWDVDNYTETADSVGGVKITNEAPAPGWVSDPDADLDYCPEHKHLLNK